MVLAKITKAIRSCVAPVGSFTLISDSREVSDEMLGICLLIGISRQYGFKKEQLVEFLGIAPFQYDEEMTKFTSYLKDEGEGDDFDQRREEFFRKLKSVLLNIHLNNDRL